MTGCLFSATKKQDGWPQGSDPVYDDDRALVICRLHKFREGAMLLYERKGLHKEALAYAMQEDSPSSIIKTAQHLVNVGGDPTLWIDVLRKFGKASTVRKRAE